MNNLKPFHRAMHKWRKRILLPIMIVASIILLTAYETTEVSVGLLVSNQLTLLIGIFAGIYTETLAMNTASGNPEPMTQRNNIIVVVILSLILFSFWVNIFWRDQ